MFLYFYVMLRCFDSSGVQQFYFPVFDKLFEST